MEKITSVDDIQQRFQEKGFALFDLDQTLIPWDTQLLFANWIIRKEPIRRLYLAVFLPFTPFASILGAGGMKRIFVSYLFGMRREDMEGHVKDFVDWLIPAHLYHEIAEEISMHRDAGRPIILTSASPEIYVKEIGRRLGCDFAYGTRFIYNEVFPLFPDLVDENNKGAQKLVRIHEELGILPQMHESSYGYSDSSADLPMLRICKNVAMVHPTPGLEKEGAEKGWQLKEPDRPSKSRKHFIVNSLKQALGLYSTESQ